jgi:hypothetical protein
VTDIGKRRRRRPHAATRRLLLGGAVVVAVGAATLGLAWADASRTGSPSGAAVAKRSIPPTTRVHKMTIAAVKHRTARVKLFGERGFRVRRIAPWSLRLRTKGPNLSSGWRRHHAFKILGDTNHDGFADARATFRISLKKRVAAGHSHAELIGILGARRHRGDRSRRAIAMKRSASASTVDTWSSFSASTELVTSDTASDYCTLGTNGSYVRCAFTTSFDESTGAVDMGTLLDDLDDDLSSAGYDSEITPSDSVMVELWGGAAGGDLLEIAARQHHVDAAGEGFGGDGPVEGKVKGERRGVRRGGGAGGQHQHHRHQPSDRHEGHAFVLVSHRQGQHPFGKCFECRRAGAAKQEQLRRARFSGRREGRVCRRGDVGVRLVNPGIFSGPVV